MPDAVRRPRVLGVLHGPQPVVPDVAAALPRVLEAFAAAGAEVTCVTADDVSARVLGALGAPQPPVLAPLRTSALVLPAAHAAVPLVAAWPLAAVTAPASVAARDDLEASTAAAVRSWRSRCVAAAYALHRAAPVDLVVAVPTVASTAVALVLAGELGVPVLSLVGRDDPADDEERADRSLLAEVARESWTLGTGADDPAADVVAAWTSEAARLLGEVAP